MNSTVKSALIALVVVVAVQKFGVPGLVPAKG